MNLTSPKNAACLLTSNAVSLSLRGVNNLDSIFVRESHWTPISFFTWLECIVFLLESSSFGFYWTSFTGWVGTEARPILSRSSRLSYFYDVIAMLCLTKLPFPMRANSPPTLISAWAVLSALATKFIFKSRVPMVFVMFYERVIDWFSFWKLTSIELSSFSI